MAVRRQRSALVRQTAGWLAAALLVTGLAGCSYLHRKAPEEGDAAAAAKAEAEQESEGKTLPKIAILPVAYNAPGGGLACDLCPQSLTMDPTSAEAARLATAFFYEKMARHPRFLRARYEIVEPLVKEKGMRAAAAELAARGEADLVLVAALLQLRPRIGDDEHPERAAGAALYAAVLDARNGIVLWSNTFDRNEKSRNWLRRGYNEVVGGVPRKWHTAEGFTETGVDWLVEDMIDEVGD